MNTVILTTGKPDLSTDCVRVSIRGSRLMVDMHAEALREFLDALRAEIGDFDILEDVPPDSRAAQMRRRR